MKKRILSAVLVSGVTLGTAVATVKADDYDTQIATKDATINNLQSEQADAQSQVDSIQSQVNQLESQKNDLESQNIQLEAKSQKLGDEIQSLSSKIVARNEALKKQVRSSQKNSKATNYINTILNSKSISDAINRVVAVREVVSANEKMLEQQKTDKALIEQKQAENQKAINTVVANKATLEQNQAALATQQAELEVAQLNLSAQLATAEDEKASLLSQKEVAEQEAIQAAQAEAEKQAQAEAEKQEQVTSATQAQQEIQHATVANRTVSTSKEQVSATANTSSNSATVEKTSAVTPTSVTSTSSSANNYPVGQCTWGAKSCAPWVGNNWGNASQWIASAQVAGHSVGTTPQVGAVAVWPYDGGGFGHVAYVTSVQSSTNIQVTEANYAGNSSLGNYRGWFDPTSSSWGGTVYYIYQ